MGGVNSRSSSDHSSRNLFSVATKLNRINAAQKNFSLTPKKRQSLQVQICAVFLALTLNFQSMILTKRTSTINQKLIYWIPERTGGD